VNTESNSHGAQLGSIRVVCLSLVLLGQAAFAVDDLEKLQKLAIERVEQYRAHFCQTGEQDLLAACQRQRVRRWQLRSASTVFGWEAARIHKITALVAFSGYGAQRESSARQKQVGELSLDKNEENGYATSFLQRLF
jgi:hypothetical protein